jgi:hypothetical protein
LLPTITITAASAQQPPIAVTPPTDIEVADSDQIIQQIISMLESSRLVDYQLYSNGTAEYTIEFVRPGASQSNWKNFTVITEHRYTSENGYVFDNATGDIITPQGKRLIISTFD